MKEKFTKSLIMALLVLAALAFSSCKKNNVKKIEVDNSFALSLVQDEVTISELLEIMDSTTTAWIRVMPDKTISAVFYDTVCDIITGAELLDSIEDIQIQCSNDIEIPVIEVPQEIQQIWEADPSYVYEFQQQYDFDTLFITEFEIENFEISSLVLKEGDMTFIANAEPESSFPGEVQSMMLQTSEIKFISGEDFQATLPNPGNVGQDMANMIVEPENGGILFSGSLIITASIDKATFEAFGGQIGGMVHIDIEGAFTDLEILNIIGVMNEITQHYIDTFDVKFGIEGIGGDLNMYKPELNLQYINTFGFGSDVAVDTLGFFVNDETGTEFMSLLREGFGVELEANQDTFVPIQEDITHHVVDYINVLGKYDGLLFKGDVTMGGHGIESLSHDSHIDLAAEAVVPLKFKINELNYSDTLSFKIDAGNVQKFLNGVEFKFRIDNALPLKITLQAYLMQEGEIIDSLLVSGNNVIKPSYDGQYEFCEIVSSVEGERVDNVLSADNLLLNVSVSTENNTVTIKSTNSMKIGIGLKTKTNGIDLDDVL